MMQAINRDELKKGKHKSLRWNKNIKQTYTYHVTNENSMSKRFFKRLFPPPPPARRIIMRRHGFVKRKRAAWVWIRSGDSPRVSLESTSLVMKFFVAINQLLMLFTKQMLLLFDLMSSGSVLVMRSVRLIKNYKSYWYHLSKLQKLLILYINKKSCYTNF